MQSVSRHLFWDRSRDCSVYTTLEDGVLQRTPAQMFQRTWFLFYLFGVEGVKRTAKSSLPPVLLYANNKGADQPVHPRSLVIALLKTLFINLPLTKLVFVAKQADFRSTWSQTPNTGPEVIQLFPCSTQLSTKFILLINVKMPTIVVILAFINMINTTYERLRARNFSTFQGFSVLWQVESSCSVELSVKKV